MKIHTTVFTAITLCVTPFACAVEDNVDDSTANKDAILQEAAEDAELALVSYVECNDEQSDDCSAEEEDLVEALQHYESVESDNDFRAFGIADCGIGKPYAICQGPGTCYATDNVGCACLNNGVLVSVASCG